MNRLEMTIELKDWEADSQSELPIVTKLTKEGNVVYPDYRHLDFIMDTVQQFLLADGYTLETVLRFIDEWVEDRSDIMDIKFDEGGVY